MQKQELKNTFIDTLEREEQYVGGRSGKWQRNWKCQYPDIVKWYRE